MDAMKKMSLLVMHLFTTVFFPQASGSVPVHMFHYVDDVKKLKNFSWGKACYEMLMENIPFCAAWCRLKERGKGAESGDTRMKHQISMKKF
jgi:hypothetical protein